MLDIKRIRDNPGEVREALLKRMDAVDFTELLDNDRRRRELIVESEKLRSEQNRVSGEIPRLKKEGKDPAELLAKMKEVSARSKDLEARLGETEAAIRTFLEGLPNIPDPDVAPGGKENNTVVRTFGEKPGFGFEPKDHVELVTKLGLIDYERGAKLGGNGFWVYTGEGARLEWALLNYFVEEHLKDGYEFVLPPHILNYDCGYAAGQFPKFDDDVFWLDGTDPAAAPGTKRNRKFLLPTAETALVNLYRGEVLNEEDLPKKFFAYTPCYRSEAGSYRTNERGMIRGHQFNKVEMFQFTRPEDSAAALEELIAKAERLVQGLGLHYRLSQLAAKDCSASMAKTYDIEIWIPSMKEYKEVSSASNGRDYQARRGNMRFKRSGSKSNELIHTLNASGLATSRLLPAIAEQFQRPDGSVVVPEVLRKWIGKDVLT
jgi:seryl-tRNA synthetase